MQIHSEADFRNYSEIKYHPNPRGKSLDLVSRSCIYLPANYIKKGPYPVLYLLHGVGDMEYSWEIHGHLSQIADDLIQQGQIEPLVVVMPFGFITQDEKLERTFPDAQAFDEHFTTFMKNVETTYSGEIDRTCRAMAGLSMGGKQTLEYGFSHLSDFEALAAFSAAVQDRGTGSAVEPILKRLDAGAEHLKLLYVSCGVDDKIGEGQLKKSNSQLVAGIRANVKIPIIWESRRGGHDWGVWSSSLRRFLSLWFQPRDTM
jgi:enterochelin esterase-like enzyme